MLGLIYKVSAVGMVVMWVLCMAYSYYYEKKMVSTWEGEENVKEEKEKEPGRWVEKIIAWIKIFFTTLCPVINTLFFVIWLFGWNGVKEKLEMAVEEKY